MAYLTFLKIRHFVWPRYFAIRKDLNLWLELSLAWNTWFLWWMIAQVIWAPMFEKYCIFKRFMDMESSFVFLFDEFIALFRPPRKFSLSYYYSKVFEYFDKSQTSNSKEMTESDMLKPYKRGRCCTVRLESSLPDGFY